LWFSEPTGDEDRATSLRPKARDRPSSKGDAIPGAGCDWKGLV
jgi:hypothetical protein